MVTQYVPEVTMKLILRNRYGEYETRIVQAGSRTGIPNGIEIIAEIPTTVEYGHEE